MKKITNCLLIILLLILPLSVKAEPLDISKNARATIMIEASTGEILYDKNSMKEYAMASLTKMMGLLIIMETIEDGGLTLDEIVTASSNAKEMGGTQIYLDTGEKMSVSDLLKSITMASANDAMVAMAERIAGTEEAFVNMMNKRAKELGLNSTMFKNSTGLDEEGHYSTAFDLAMIAKELIKHEQILEFTKVYEAYIRNNTDNKTWISNTNKLVRFYNGADGLKTGYTDAAKRCIAATAVRNGLRLIVINLGYEKSDVRNTETMAVLDYGFNIWKANVLKPKGTIVDKLPLDGANKEEVNLVLKEDAKVIEKKIDKNIEYTYQIELDEIKYPIKTDDTIGHFNILKNNEIIKKVPIGVQHEIEKVNIIIIYLRNLKNLILGIL